MLKSLTLASIVLAVAAGSAPASPFKAPAAPREALIVPADHIILYGPDIYVGPRVRRGYAPRYLYRKAPPIFLPAEPYGWNEDLSPREVRSALRQQGYRNVERVRRAGRFYKARVRDSRSNLVWVTVSAADGRVVRTRVVERAAKEKSRRVARATQREKSSRKVARAPRVEKDKVARAPRVEKDKVARAPRVKEDDVVSVPRPYQSPKRDIARGSEDSPEDLARRAPDLPAAKPSTEIAETASQETYVAARVDAGIPREEPATPDVASTVTDAPAAEIVVDEEAAAAPVVSDRDPAATETRSEPSREFAEAPSDKPVGEGDASEDGDEEPINDAVEEPDETAAIPAKPETPHGDPKVKVAAVTPAPQEVTAPQETVVNGEQFEDTELTPDESEGTQQAGEAAADAAAPVETAALIPPQLPRVKPRIIPTAVRRVDVDEEIGGEVRLQRSPRPEAAVRDNGVSPSRPAQASIALTPPAPAKMAEPPPAPEEPTVAAMPRTDPADVPVRNPLVVYE